jgi:hypothetical protein
MCGGDARRSSPPLTDAHSESHTAVHRFHKAWSITQSSIPPPYSLHRICVAVWLWQLLDPCLRLPFWLHTSYSSRICVSVWLASSRAASSAEVRLRCVQNGLVVRPARCFFTPPLSNFLRGHLAVGGHAQARLQRGYRAKRRGEARGVVMRFVVHMLRVICLCVKACRTRCV